MKKSDLKEFMIVRNGYDDMLLLIENMYNEWAIVRSPTEEEYDSDDFDKDGGPIGFEEYEFNDDLVHIEDPILSIVEVYDSIPLECPFNLDVDKLFDEYSPELLWKREPSKISKSKLESFASNKDAIDYISTIVPPYIIVE